ncbi:MAG: RraA family protein, partial [Planctomycetota bacterium]|nr:RraA family protein [Planctomycetota bacterium]
MTVESDLRAGYLELQTAVVGDVLDEMGWRKQIFPWQIQALVRGTKLFGQAFTVIGETIDDPDEDDNAARVAMISNVTPDSIAVVSSGDNHTAAHWGEITGLAARNAGCLGAVCDGGARDVGQLIRHGFPLFAKFRTPAASTGRWSMRTWQKQITVGDVAVNPGDYILGDDDGVVAIPRALGVEVLEKAETKAETER